MRFVPAGRAIHFVLPVLLLCGCSAPLAAPTGAGVQARIDADLADGRPIVVHVVVALCDNANQGIVPVPASLGNGRDPSSNLYWGALYGVKTWFTKQGWDRANLDAGGSAAVLERVVLHRTLPRNGREVPVFVVAEAWDGARIRESIERFLELAAGARPEPIELDGQGRLTAGGAAHLVVFVGHNGLMDFSIDPGPRRRADRPAASSAVLACASKPYFLDRLTTSGSHPLLLTTGLMAPEAYSLESAIREWASGASASSVQSAAAAAYDRYQKCGPAAARRLFWGAD